MISMFKSKRMKELESKERELFMLRLKIDEVKHWCAADSPEIGFCMLHLQSLDKCTLTISKFRDNLRKGYFTFEAFKLTQK